jgi:two-component system sensor histidine kinase KdpD
MGKRDQTELAYLAAGPLVALVLGIVLIPLRGVTSASNLTFFFIVLTIVVAEFGGRWPAVATALVSALSLDFFLTQPYLHLQIVDKHDIVAFLGLAACGLVAAALGSERGTRRSDLRQARAERQLLHDALLELESGAALKYRATRLVESCRMALPLSAVALRDDRDQLVAGTAPIRAVPRQQLQSDTLLPVTNGQPPAAPAPVSLPADGARVALNFDGRRVGWLDLWSEAGPLSAEARQTLSDVGRVAAALLDVRAARPG